MAQGMYRGGRCLTETNQGDEALSASLRHSVLFSWLIQVHAHTHAW